MPPNEVQEILNFFLNPYFWDGHSLGYCQDLEPARVPRKKDNDIAASTEALLARIALMERAIPLETFESGQVFDPEIYHPGTVVLFRKDSLMGKIKDAPKPEEFEELKKLEVPQRMTEVHTNFGEEKICDYVKVGDTMYISASTWGVVGMSAVGKVLHTISTNLVDKIGGGKAVITNNRWDTPLPPYKVGETRHNKIGKSEILERINILKVVGYGITVEKEQRAGATSRKRLQPGLGWT